ncbi:hypothetical protein ACHAW6_000212, partial [Cyclotella cf. meneghiniana]
TNKVKAILAITVPKQVKDLGSLDCPTHLISRRVGPYQYWNEVHQVAFDNVKATIAKDVVLSYSDYSK